MENLPDEVRRRILRATDEDTEDMDEGVGQVDRAFLRLTRELRQPWVIRVTAAMGKVRPPEGASPTGMVLFAYPEHKPMYARMMETGSRPDSVRVELEGDHLDFPLIPRFIMAGLRKIEIINTGPVTMTTEYRSTERAEIQITSLLFLKAITPNLRKLIAPAFALSTDELPPDIVSPVRTIECYMRRFGFSPNPWPILDNYPALERLRVHGAWFPQNPDSLALPPSVTRFWFKSVGTVSFVKPSDLYLLLADNPQLTELYLERVHLTRRWDVENPVQVGMFVERIAWVQSQFPSARMQRDIRAWFTPHVQWVERDVDVPGVKRSAIEDGEPNTRPTKRSRYEALLRTYFGALVPRDGRDEAVDNDYLLRRHTTLFRAVVKRRVPVQQIEEPMFGLNLNRVASELIEAVREGRGGGGTVVYVDEYETQHDMHMGRVDDEDEVELPRLEAAQDLFFKRTFPIPARLLGQVSPQKGDRVAEAGRWVEPGVGGLGLYRVEVERAHMDRDYLHMVQFKTKASPAYQMRMSEDAMAAQLVMAGGEAVKATYVYDATRRHRFLPPILYRDEDGPRETMPYCVGLVVRVGDQVVAQVVERGYEERVQEILL
jgi:hypothetical protein